MDMESVDNEDLNYLRIALTSTRAKVTALEAQLAELEAKRAGFTPAQDATQTLADNPNAKAAPRTANQLTQSVPSTRWPLHPDEYRRYGRQMIMPEIGLQGQLGLKRSRVLIVGLGGLGCPAATYLAGAGVGVLGLVDDDTISLSNLHRQTLYAEHTVGKSKVEIALSTLKKNNAAIKYHTYNIRLTPGIALELFSSYDLILDCTDHPSSRYLISDVAVLTSKPLVSASALRTEGQLLVLNYSPHGQGDEEQRFCYRCVFPKPPPPESITTCGEGGILGPVVGIMGVLMAMEAIKILSSYSSNALCEPGIIPANQPSLLLYSAYSSPPFRSVQLKGRRKDCISCSKNATISRESLTSGSLDYVAFCGLAPKSNVLSDHERISPQDFAALQQNKKKPHVLIDVREPVEFRIGHINESINLPFSMINRNPEASLVKLEDTLASEPWFGEEPELYFVCKLGNDSQVAIAKLKDVPRFNENHKYECKGDIKGGLWQWKERVDPAFPDYGAFPANLSN